MGTLLHWLSENWFNLLQGIGIVAGLLFTGLSIRRDTQARRMSDLLVLTEQHRELWCEVYQRAELNRILASEIDLVATPLSFAEKEFLNTIIVHFHTGWLLARAGAVLGVEALAADVRNFFRLPLPRAVWIETKSARAPEFVRFVEQCIARD